MKRVNLLNVLTFLLLSGMMMYACKKKTKISQISGRLVDPNQNISVSDVRVELFAKKVESGTYNSSYSTIRTVYTDAGGEFSISFDAIRAISYKLEFGRDGYYITSTEFVSDDISIDHDDIYNIFSEAFLNIHIKNVSPVDSSDKISYQLYDGTMECYGCCSDSIFIYTGVDVDATKSCKTYGHINIPVGWYVSKDTLTVHYSDTVFCSAFDTTFFDIFY